MDEKIKDYFENGLAKQLFEAWKNFKIWKHIANEVDFLKTLEKDKQDLYIFVQQSAQTNFILAISKIFDKKSKQYDTRCLDEFLSILNEYNGFNDDFNPPKLKDTLQRHNNKNLIIAADESIIIFLKKFSKYYKNKIADDLIQKTIDKIKDIRDKSIAHNEVFIITKLVEMDEIERLMIFVNEIINVFASAFYDSSWQIEFDAERNSNFIKETIKKLK